MKCIHFILLRTGIYIFLLQSDSHKDTSFLSFQILGVKQFKLDKIKIDYQRFVTVPQRNILTLKRTITNLRLIIVH